MCKNSKINGRNIFQNVNETINYQVKRKQKQKTLNSSLEKLSNGIFKYENIDSDYNQVNINIKKKHKGKGSNISLKKVIPNKKDNTNYYIPNDIEKYISNTNTINNHDTNQENNSNMFDENDFYMDKIQQKKN